MNSYDSPWVDMKNYKWSHHIRGRSADVVILDDYAENLGDALNNHMADAYKQSALDELFGVK
jgi:hypothetical protein